MKFPALAAVLLGAALPALLAQPSRPTALAAAGAWLAWLGIGMLVASLLLMVREPVWSGALSGLEHMYLWHRTRNIQALEPGVSVRIQGPYGRFLGERSESPELWIAGGIGITPFLSQLRARPATQPTLLIYVHRESSDVPYLAELRRQALAQSSLRLLDLQLGNDPGPLFPVLEGIHDLRTREVYLCGPPPLVEAVRQWLQRHGIPAARIHFERFDFR